MFQTAKQEAETAGREFKWFTNRPNHSTYIFNPFLQEPFESMTISDVTGFFISSLNLHHGSDYGRAYFGLMARSLLQESLRMSEGQSGNRARLQSRAPKPVESFEELCEIVHELTNSNDEYRNASHLVHVIRNLADFRQLNLNPALVRDEDERTAVEHAIHMPDVISKKQVVYFYLTPAHDEVTVCEMARLAIFATLNAALDHQTRTGKAARVVLVCDEAQLVIAKNISQVLAQARSAGVGMVLCHQTLSQLNPPGGADLRDIVLNCTVAKQFWSARDPESKEYISKISGDVGYYSASWNQTKRRVLGGEIGRRFAAASVEDPLFISINEQEGPRLTSQDIENYSRHPNMSIVSIHRNHGYSCYDGAFPCSHRGLRRKRLTKSWLLHPGPNQVARRLSSSLIGRDRRITRTIQSKRSRKVVESKKTSTHYSTNSPSRNERRTAMDTFLWVGIGIALWFVRRRLDGCVLHYPSDELSQTLRQLVSGSLSAIGLWLVLLLLLHLTNRALTGS